MGLDQYIIIDEYGERGIVCDNKADAEEALKHLYGDLSQEVGDYQDAEGYIRIFKVSQELEFKFEPIIIEPKEGKKHGNVKK